MLRSAAAVLALAVDLAVDYGGGVDLFRVGPGAGREPAYFHATHLAQDLQVAMRGEALELIARLLGRLGLEARLQGRLKKEPGNQVDVAIGGVVGLELVLLVALPGRAFVGEPAPEGPDAVGRAALDVGPILGDEGNVRGHGVARDPRAFRGTLNGQRGPHDDHRAHPQADEDPATRGVRRGWGGYAAPGRRGCRCRIGRSGLWFGALLLVLFAFHVGLSFRLRIFGEPLDRPLVPGSLGSFFRRTVFLYGGR